MPNEQMMALGEYRFSVSTAAYHELTRSAEYRWAAQERLGRLPARQYLGPGAETVSLSGVIHPYYRGGLGQLDRMRAEAGRGEPLDLSTGDGTIMGKWVVTRIEETRRVLDADGAPRRVEFRLQLARYGEGQNRSLQQIVFGGD
ncbi:MAG: phage tail protein [Bryobacterales bacterium]|nr:phage tail protein [Bryobacterales bacterium]